MGLPVGWIPINYKCVFSPLKSFSVDELNIHNIKPFVYVFHLLDYNFDNLSDLLLKLFETPLTDRENFCESFEKIHSEICSLWMISEKQIKTLDDLWTAQNQRECTFMYIIEEYSIYSVLQNIQHYMPNGAPEQEDINKARNCFIEFSLTLYAYIWPREGNAEGFRNDDCDFNCQVNEMALRYCETFVRSVQYSEYKKPPYRLLRIHQEIEGRLRNEIINHEVNRLLKKGWGRRIERRYIFTECANSKWRVKSHHDYTVPRQEVCDYYSRCAAKEIKNMYRNYLIQKFMEADSAERRWTKERWDEWNEISNKASEEEMHIPENEEDEFYSYILSSKKLKPIGLDKLDNVIINKDFYPRLVLSNQKDRETHYIVDHLEDIFALCFYYVLKSKEYVYRCPNCHKLSHRDKKMDYCSKGCRNTYSKKIQKLSEPFNEYEKIRKRLVARISRILKLPQYEKQMETFKEDIKEINDVLDNMKNKFDRMKRGELSSDEFMNYLKEVDSKKADIDISD